MMTKEKLRIIKSSIQNFDGSELLNSSVTFLNALDYVSSKTMSLVNNTSEGFVQSFDFSGDSFRPQKALTNEWKKIELVFQITDEEISQQESLFYKNDLNRNIYKSFLFLTVQLKKESYKRAELVQITRELNRPFKMPVIVLFYYGNKLTLSVIKRRPHKRDKSKDVLQKVTLIKDINISSPHRAHLEILKDLSLKELNENFEIHGFDDLLNAWEKTLNISELNKKFYREIANWYFWAVSKVKFPKSIKKGSKIKNFLSEDKNDKALNVIRLLTRVIFIWFLKEKSLVPPKLFDKNFIRTIIKNFTEKESSNYYKAILQNLFFATLNAEMNKDKPNNRRFVESEFSFENNKSEYGVKTLYRYSDLFAIQKDEAVKLFENIPFLNGGLFDCLDKEDEETKKVMYFDGFTRNKKLQPIVPDELFFNDDAVIDLSAEYDDKKKKEIHVSGLFNILNKYKFTVEENTPVEEEVALDPELLGRVFENLLAEYNPETQKTARKSTGSYYTPREIVSYMVDESLIAYLKNSITEFGRNENQLEEDFRLLLSFNPVNPFNNEPEIQEQIIRALDKAKILDPAVGSGAFPMGVLQKMAHILHKVDPENQEWKQRQIDKLNEAIKKLEEIEDPKIRQQTIDELEKQRGDIEDAFSNNELDYGRKLYLIENCIYGVDIQTIAIQIAKLRFFISLIVDQKIDKSKQNFGIRPLPNLETKFVAANTLIGIEKPKGVINNEDIEIKELEEKLRQNRHKLFNTRNSQRKKDLIDKAKKIRKKITERIKELLFDKTQNEIEQKQKYFDNAINKLRKLQQQPEEIEIIEEINLFGETNTHKVDKKAQKIKNQKEIIKQLEKEIQTLREIAEGDKINKTARKLADWDPYDQNISAPFFDTEWMFGIKDGFDIVIGNPPYVRADSGEDYLKFRKNLLASKQYETLWEKWDLYIPFMERGFKILSQKGVITFIIPSAYLTSKYALKSRQFFIKNSRIDRIDFLMDLDVFDATVKNIIFQFSKADFSNYKPKRLKHTGYFGNITELQTDFQISLKENVFNEKLKKEIKFENTIDWGQIFYVSKGIVANADEKKAQGLFKKSDLISEVQDATHSKQYIEGKDIKAYKIEKIRYLEWDTERIPQYLSRPTFEELYVSPKIVRGRMTGAIYDNNGLISNDSTFISTFWNNLKNVQNRSINNSVAKDFKVKGKRAIALKREELNEISKNFEIKYCLSILNSKFANWFFNQVRRNAIGLYPDDIKKLPVKVIPKSEQSVFVILVNIVITTKAKNPKNIRTFFEDVIDAMVLELYFLEHLKERKIDILKYVEQDINQVIQGKEFEQLTDFEKEEIIKKLLAKWTDTGNEVVKRMSIFKEKSPDIIKPILES